ncbi:hypothetical protein [Phenylobacterium sp.]
MKTVKILIVAASAAAALVVGLSAQGADHRDPRGGPGQVVRAN